MKDWNRLIADRDKILDKHFTVGRKGERIRFIVIHHNAGNLTIDSIYATWQNRRASAHYQVCADGTIGQLVYDANTAWHAGDFAANLRSIGIEHANDNFKTWSVAPKAVEEGAHLVAALCVYYKLGRPAWGKNVFPHVKFEITECPGGLLGPQRDHYMARAQYWYDEMMRSKVNGGASGGNVGTSVPKPVSKPVSKPAVKVPMFPLPKGFYYGPASGPAESVSGRAFNQHVKHDVVKSRNGVYYSKGLQAWQARLRDLGWSIRVDGKYGPETANVARKIQRVHGLSRDSLIGPDTWKAVWSK